MADAKPGDNPLTDILVYKLERFGTEADEFIRGVSDFSSRHELHEWWNRELKGETDPKVVLQKARDRYHELMMRSQATGWGQK